MPPKQKSQASTKQKKLETFFTRKRDEPIVPAATSSDVSEEEVNENKTLKTRRAKESNISTASDSTESDGKKADNKANKRVRKRESDDIAEGESTKRAKAGEERESPLENISPRSEGTPATPGEPKVMEEKKEEVMEEEEEEMAVVVDTSEWGQKLKDIGIWKKGEPVPYLALCKTFELIEPETKRLAILDMVTNFFRAVIELTPDNLLQVVYLCINKLCPDYEGLELGIGEMLLMKAVGEATGRSLQSIREEFHKTGDLGDIAQKSRGKQPTMFKPKSLTVPNVYKTLKEIAKITGSSSQTMKVNKIKGMLVACRGNEAKYLIRSLEGKLRIGLAEKTILVALAHAITLSRETRKLKKEKLEMEIKNAVETLKSVYNELPTYDLIVPNLLEYGAINLKDNLKMTPGIPLKPMLAHPTKSITEVLTRFQDCPFTCEFKYDGERAQIHKLEDGKASIFSRNSENMSAKYPDILERLGKFVKSDTKSFILDCEVVAWDMEEKCLLPFQILSTRKRKDVKEDDIKVKVCLFAFDLLYLNGEPLIQKPFMERRELLHSHFQEVSGEFSFACYKDLRNVDEIQTFLDESIAAHCEGLMVKTLVGDEASYEPSKRSRNWLKIKKDYLDGFGDTVDLVVIGAYYGRGKRTNFYGAYLLACYDPGNEEYQTICKIGTGFSEEDLEIHYKELQGHLIDGPKRYYSFAEGTKPDVWFEPAVVWEVMAADLSISPVYRAAIGHVDGSKGISLRFPRFIKLREDKHPEEATTSDQIAEFYRKQQLNSEKKVMESVDDGFDY
ncbi:uncharacterized protein VTP21DRAFT_216 [Calcarisporiella thermophila]|uniref:uncharacterized protein n=1 Tax=Calcarisporiella thermophila TaxID=911321 RepID=UPI00374264AD